MPRTALVERLARERIPGLILLAAPAGYGKTWLGAQVATRWTARGMVVRTWRLQSGCTVRSALRSLAEGFEIKVARAEDDADALLARLRRRDTRDEAALIVDVDGAPPSKAVQSLVARVVLELAPERRTLVSGRHARLLPGDRVSVRLPSMQVLRAQELAIRPDEPGAPPRPDAWWLLTQGWPLLCGQAGDADLEQMVGAIGPYLEHELLAPLQGTEVELLMHASTVDSVDSGVLEALELGATWRRLWTQVERGLPLSTAQGGWDRVVLHPVFRRFLQRRLLAHAPGTHRALHRRAARHFAAAHRFVEAMRHAQQAGDATLEAQIAERGGGWRLSWREGLQAISPAAGGPVAPEVDARFPRAALARIYWQAQTGRVEEARQALERLERDAPAPTMANDLLSVRAVIAIYRDEEVDEDLVRQLGEMRQDPADQEPLLLPGGATLQAALLNNAGHYDRAAQAARAAILDAEVQGSRYVAYYGQLQHGLALLGQGRCDDAVAPLQQAQASATELFGVAGGECRTVGLLLAHAAWLAGRNDEAERSAAELADLYRLHAWLEPYARILQVAMAVARDRGGRSLEERVIEDIGDLAARRGLPRLRSLVAVARARRMADEGRVEQAEAACDAVIASMSAMRPEFAARVLATAWLEKARSALARSAFDAAGQAMTQFERWNATLCDGVLATEGGLIASYLAVRERRHRDAAQRFSRCVLDAQRTGLRRPFIDHAAWVDEWVRHARAHAVPVDAQHLRLASAYAGAPPSPGSAAAPRLAGALRVGLLLTQRETDILRCLSHGMSSKEMARQLSITEATVKTHRKHLYEKLGVGLRSQALVKARELGVL